MLNILLIMLRAAGITAAVLLGLAVLILLLILLAPVRYSASGSWADDVRPQLEMNITWLMRVLTGSIRYGDGLGYELRIFGKVVESSDSGAASPDLEAEISETDPREFEAAAEQPSESERTEVQMHELNEARTQMCTAGDMEEPDMPSADEPHLRMNGPKDDIGAEKREKTAKEHGAGRIRRLIRRARDRVKSILSSLLRFLRRLRENGDGVTAFLRDQGHRRAISLLWGSLKRLLVHIWPRHMAGHLTFGFEDPSMTGYALAMLSMLPSGRENDMTVTPLFDRRGVDCEARIRGRLRLIVPAAIIVKIYRDEDCKKLYSEVTNGGK